MLRRSVSRASTGTVRCAAHRRMLLRILAGCLACGATVAALGLPAVEVSVGRLPSRPSSAVGPPEDCTLFRSELTPGMLELPYDADAWRATLQFYDTATARASWLTRDGFTATTAELLDLLRTSSGRDGLEPGPYAPEPLATALAAPVPATPLARCTLDFALSYRLALYATHLARGRVGSDGVDLPVQTDLAPFGTDIAAVIAEALSGAGVRRALDTIRPSHPWYGPLVDARQRYRAIARMGGWPSVPAGETIEPGDVRPADRILSLARRLEREGFLDPTPPAKDGASLVPRIGGAPGEPTDGLLRYNQALVEAVTSFQAHHGLDPDGVVGARTLRALNVPIEKQLGAIDTTLEHMRWLGSGASAPPAAVVINVPGFELHLVEYGHITLRLRTIVGRRSWRTPLLSSAIDHLVLNPAWNIPDSITRGEIIAKLEAEPDYLDRQSIAVLDDTGEVLNPADVDWAAVRDGTLRVRLRQTPGALNPLGRIKFQFASPFGVYLHDTNAVALFDQPSRALSHGCLRLDRPLDLTERLLRRSAPTWSVDRVSNAIADGGRDRVPLVPPIPIHVVYWTAGLGPDGRIAFYDDVYAVGEATRVALEAIERGGRGTAP